MNDLDASIAFLESFTALRASAPRDAGDRRSALLLPPAGLPGLNLVQDPARHGVPHDRIVERL